ncbi:MAG: recombinase family protein, partial [Novosphingobium sp.]
MPSTSASRATLEQDFNSLDAQREACSAYIRSQASEGWTDVGERYDDGGISGGTLERPELKYLLEDVTARQIDTRQSQRTSRRCRSRRSGWKVPSLSRRQDPAAHRL